MSYDGVGNLTLTATRGANTISKTLPSNLLSILTGMGGYAYLGFTGGDSGTSSTQLISNFSLTYSPTTSVGCAPREHAADGQHQRHVDLNGTLNDAFIIMDEAQNTTSEQMKMFLTRLGSNSKAVITGDVTQIDLPNPKKSGLVEAIEILRGVDGIRFCHFEDGDVVRHHLVQRVIRAYDSFGRAQRELPLNLRESAPAKSAPKPQ